MAQDVSVDERLMGWLREFDWERLHHILMNVGLLADRKVYSVDRKQQIFWTGR
jgi:hypothetical protein